MESNFQLSYCLWLRTLASGHHQMKHAAPTFRYTAEQQALGAGWL